MAVKGESDGVDEDGKHAYSTYSPLSTECVDTITVSVSVSFSLSFFFSLSSCKGNRHHNFTFKN